MNNAILVAMFHSTEYLSKYFSYFGLIKTFLYVFKQASTIYVFHDNEIYILEDSSSISYKSHDVFVISYFL